MSLFTAIVFLGLTTGAMGDAHLTGLQAKHTATGCPEAGGALALDADCMGGYTNWMTTCAPSATNGTLKVDTPLAVECCPYGVALQVCYNAECINLDTAIAKATGDDASMITYQTNLNSGNACPNSGLVKTPAEVQAIIDANPGSSAGGSAATTTAAPGGASASSAATTTAAAKTATKAASSATTPAVANFAAPVQASPVAAMAAMVLAIFA